MPTPDPAGLPPAPGSRGATPVYSPWLEDPEELAARTVGRAEVLERIRAGAARLLRGERPLPLYLFGPRGIGKSHLVTVGASEVRMRLVGSGVKVHVIGEDIPAPRDARDLWGVLVGNDEVPAWMDWSGATRATVPSRTVVFVEGWDRLLDYLKPTGRKELRAHLQDHPEVWLVATGARLGEVLTGRDEAFFGSFEPIPLSPLDDEQARPLLDRRVGEEARQDPRWEARREALLTLAGGNPRALLALVDAVAAVPGEEVARRLLEVLDAFTPHYQLRFRDCAAQEQRLVDLLSRAPRALGPSEIASILGETSQVWSSVGARLEEHGLLAVDRAGRNAWYRLTEPLFRHWLEYRNAPVGQSRIGWLGRLLERVLGPEELVAAWSQGDDPEVQAAARGAILRRPDARASAWSQAMLRLDQARGEPETATRARAVDATLQAMLELRPDAAQAWPVVLSLVNSTDAKQAARLAPALRAAGVPTLASLALATGQPVEPRRLLRDLASVGAEELARSQAWTGDRAQATARALPALLDQAIRWKERHGRPWKVSAADSLALAAIPGLRYRLLRHGRHITQPPVIDLEHLIQVALKPDDPDLELLLWLSMVRRSPVLAGRLTGLLDLAPAPRLPWCPWPGRRLALDLPTLARVVARAPGTPPISWLGALATLPDDDLHPVLDSLATRPAPSTRTPTPPGLELALARLLFDAPGHFEVVERSLGVPWRPVTQRVRVLVAQLAEARRGPLHPELERVRRALQDPEPA